MTQNQQLSEDDPWVWDRNPRLRNLRDILYRKAGKAIEMFRMRDTNMIGLLSINEMSKICTELDPHIEVRKRWWLQSTIHHSLQLENRHSDGNDE